MICKKCQQELQEDWKVCPWCGASVVPSAKVKRSRPSGAGTAYKRGKTWTAEVTLGYRSDAGSCRRKYLTKGGFKTKTEALAYCGRMKVTPKDKSITLSALFTEWAEGYAERVGRSTMAGYRSAFKHFSDIQFMRVGDIKASDWQRCMDACAQGKRTKEYMRTVAGLLSKYAFSNDMIHKNYAADLYTGKEKKGTYPPFTLEEVAAIKAAVGACDYADYVLFLIYTGFRPSEMFGLRREAYHPEGNYLIGGGKTKAGTDRVIPISVRLTGILSARLAVNSPLLFPRLDGKKMECEYFRKFCFNPLMEQLGIEDRYPYSCRHTFANLLKNASGSDTDKAALMGHSNISMTRYYQSEDFSSLRGIIEQL